MAWPDLPSLTFVGPMIVVAPEEDLGEGGHPASPLFHAAHHVITRVRIIAESQPLG